MRRRNFLAGSAAGIAASFVPALALAQDVLPDLAAGAVPITVAERQARVARAGELMRQHDMAAVLVEAGTSLRYFTGVQWWRSERLTAAVLTRDGELAIITPFFEEPSVRETLALPAELLTWDEDEDPTAKLGKWLSARGLGQGRIGIEETVRHFAVDGLAAALPAATLVSGNPVVRSCRMIKSDAELALMQRATDITMAAYRHAAPRIERGMAPSDIGALINGATKAMGGAPEFALVLLGEASAYPHGSGKRQEVRDGEVILLDCGCNVEGYQSDISRSFVFGEADARQRQVWQQMRQGQDVAFAAAQPGATAGSVDEAVRTFYEGLGYGPGYRLPGTSHRTGHGIGLDGHEPVHLVRGEQTRLAPGMCFSNEPGIYIPEQFGIRLEDCFWMEESGPRWFSTPAPSIDDPFG
ncbi:M24 family metallopeptidase [Croceibacterium ferulae]|uniref:M24 family metallopeptidase n=1 Tax=Croceibacterium ferulae TaxID=1854641 RepID=UPI000EAF072F|nr:Xaa-Pro peptidase family protein [Croceibacterium ferulae]